MHGIKKSSLSVSIPMQLPYGQDIGYIQLPESITLYTQAINSCELEKSVFIFSENRKLIRFTDSIICMPCHGKGKEMSVSVFMLRGKQWLYAAESKVHIFLGWTLQCLYGTRQNV